MSRAEEIVEALARVLGPLARPEVLQQVLEVVGGGYVPKGAGLRRTTRNAMMRADHKKGHTLAQLARRYGLNPRQVRRIVERPKKVVSPPEGDVTEAAVA